VGEQLRGPLPVGASDRQNKGHNGVMHAAAVSFDLHIPQSRSLKAKRAVIRPIVEGLRNRFRLSVAEVGYQDQWQRAEIAVAVVAESEHRVTELLDAAERFVAGAPEIELLDVQTAWLESEDL
jgi:uncharacterized protein YlxP (DUF503 family)